MSDLPADSSALPPQTRSESWSRNRFLFFIAFALAFHLALIVIFGTTKPIVPRAVTKVPHLQLATAANELIALGDPTLFARPNAHDFVTEFWQRPPVASQPDFNWTEAPRWLLQPDAGQLGAAFIQFMQTNEPSGRPLNFTPAPEVIEPVIASDGALPPATTLQISGELARRLLTTQTNFPSIQVNDVIPPSKVQALVDPAGNVASAVLLESSTLAAADQQALQLARNLRFTPAPRLMFGEITFVWHTVPVISVATNAP